MQPSEILCLVICLKLFVRAFGDTAASDIGTLDEKKCSNARKGCCDNLHIIFDEVTAKCVLLHKDKIPAEDEKSPTKLIGFLSCLVECIYKSRNYLTKAEDIDMQAVKEDVAITYADRPKEQQYYIEMYDYCRKDAAKIYGQIKGNPASKIFFKKACKPYYTFVYLCQAEYHKKTTCPYFTWEGDEKPPTKQECKSAKDQCYKIDGLTPPEEYEFDP
ncbi:LOW QUALITY PROTEIN: uncharacterized protein LOC126757640 [Bactrocera neohumeralis]|uniref:LOW QUALITY PROTEIN: uncharacterized protein LOC126757640 n=1 Tax=Bactrocera neohumeralis TaxID=98809 RepID=UPI002164F59F|nr:LOW QUALITY PROTEIN: uncharacterized protein LOC126757640 [Bactrocera neohumeralis]